MLTKKFDSTCVDAAGYDPVKKELVVKFKGGKVYRYSGIGGHVYAGLMGAESPGRFVHQVLRSYAGEEVADIEEEKDAGRDESGTMREQVEEEG